MSKINYTENINFTDSLSNITTETFAQLADKFVDYLILEEINNNQSNTKLFHDQIASKLDKILKNHRHAIIEEISRIDFIAPEQMKNTTDAT